jgi:bisanhydrobacterioruberin hydratase
MKPFQITIARYLVVLFYTVGVAGILWITTRPVFIGLIPAALLLNTIILLIFHSWNKSKTDLFVFILIFAGSFTAEVIGVRTGLLFGHYSYGPSLGVKVWGVPLIIGLNWFVLVYAASGLFSKLRWHAAYSLFFPAVALVIYDILLEIMAPRLQMWHWHSGAVPLKNYFDWFLLSILLLGILKVFKVNTKNPLSATVFFSQFTFFLILTIFGL